MWELYLCGYGEGKERGGSCKTILVIKADSFSAQEDMWPTYSMNPQYQQFLLESPKYAGFIFLRAGNRGLVAH